MEEVSHVSTVHAVGAVRRVAADPSANCGSREGPVSSERPAFPGGSTLGLLASPRAGDDPGTSRRLSAEGRLPSRALTFAHGQVSDLTGDPLRDGVAVSVQSGTTSPFQDGIQEYPRPGCPGCCPGQGLGEGAAARQVVTLPAVSPNVGHIGHTRCSEDPQMTVPVQGVQGGEDSRSATRSSWSRRVGCSGAMCGFQDWH